MSDWSAASLRAELHAAKRGGPPSLYDILHEGAKGAGLPFSLVLAVASRETNIRNIVGDAGHGHGPLQLDDRSHKIPPGWQEDPAEIVGVCCKLLAGLTFWAMRRWPGFTWRQQLKIACAGYNAGQHNAERGVAEGDADRHTTGHDYGADCLAREAVFRELLQGKALA